MAKENEHPEDDSQVHAADDEQRELPLGDEVDERDQSVAESEDKAAEEQSEQPAGPSFRELAKDYGLDLSSFEDDAAAAAHLNEQLQTAKQQSELATYGQEFVKHAADGSWQQYQQWKAEQQAKSQQDDQAKLWDPPEWNPSWLSMLKQDEHGNIVPDPSKGGSPEHVAKFHRYLAYRQEQQDRFWSDPFGYLDPYVSKKAEELAKRIVDERLSEFGSEIDARQFVLANDWLWEDKARRTLSPEGKLFAEEFKKLDDDPDFKGLTQRGKEKLAMDKVEAFRKQREASTTQTAEDKKRATLQKAAGYTPSAAGSTNRTDRNGTPLAQDDNASFREMLQAAFDAEGYEPHQELVEV